jgi:uncharacterized protein (TIGR02996 family)
VPKIAENPKMPRSDEDGLLAAIRDNPNDDTPRLVYADWLQEHGDEDRAEFIRLQCAATRLPEGDKERRKKEKAAAALLKAHKAEWFGPVWKKFHSTKPAVSHCRIDRGFVTSLKGDIDDVVSRADDIARFAPCLRRVEVTHVREGLSALLGKPFLRTVAVVRLGSLNAASLAALKDYPGWGAFDALGLNFEFDGTADTLAGLADAPLVKSARRLDLQYGYFLHQDQPMEVGDAAAQGPSLREMRRLKIPHLRGFGIHAIDADSAAALAAWPQFKKLDWLNFSICNIEDEAAVTLLSARSLPELTRLSLNENDLHTPTAEAVAASPKLSRLTELDLSWNNLRDSDAKILANSTTLPPTLRLDVTYNRLTERGLARLRERFGTGLGSRDQL